MSSDPSAEGSADSDFPGAGEASLVVEDDGGDAEIEEMKRRIEEEERKLAALTQSLDTSGASPAASRHSSAAAAASAASAADSAEIDSRSVYVGQVDYSATTEDLKELFSACGPVNRVTILVDKISGNPKGFAYVEFKDTESVQNACLLHDTEFKGRQLKVTPKRTNVPIHQLRGRGRGGPFRGRGAPRGRGGSFYRGRGAHNQFKNQKAVYAPY